MVSYVARVGLERAVIVNFDGATQHKIRVLIGDNPPLALYEAIKDYALSVKTQAEAEQALRSALRPLDENGEVTQLDPTRPYTEKVVNELLAIVGAKVWAWGH